MNKSHPKLDPAVSMKISRILPDPANEREVILWDNVDDLATRFESQGFMPFGAIVVREVDAADWWKAYNASPRRHDQRWKDSVNLNFIPRSGKILQVVAGEHRWHGAIKAKLTDLYAMRFHGSAEEAKELQIAENTGKAWTEKELLLIVKKAVDAGRDFDTIRRLTGKNANWIENRIAVSILPLQVLQSIGSYASVSAMKALAKLYDLIGKSKLFPDRAAVDLVVRDIVARWEEKERPAGWLEDQARQWEGNSQQSFMFGSPVPNERDLEEKEFGGLLSRYRRNVADLSSEIQTYLHGWKTSHPDASMADFVHAAASRKHTRVGQLLDSFRIAEVETRKLITLLCVEGEEEAACKLLQAKDTCDAQPGTCTAPEKREPSKYVPKIDADDDPREIATKLTTGLLNAWKSGDLPEAIAKAWVEKNAVDRPSDHWSLNNIILMILQGTTDARGTMQWYKAKRVVRTGAAPIYIWGPFRSDGQAVSRSNPPDGYFPIPVYAVEDTIGEPLPASSTPIALNELPPLLDVAKKIKVPVRYTPPPASKDYAGYYLPSQRSITLHVKDWAVYFHELSHAVDHHLGQYPMIGNKKTKAGRASYARGEIVAETSAACLMTLYGAPPDKGAEAYIKREAERLKLDSHIGAVKLLLSRVINVITFILTCGAHPEKECPPKIIKKLDQKQRKACKKSGKCQAKLHASEPACPPKAKRLTLEIGNEKLEEVCVTRISPGKDYAGFIAEKSGDLYAVNFTAARGSVTINETRTVKAIVDAKGRRWPGKWKFVRSPQGRYAMVREP